MKSREKRDCWIYAICMMILAEAFSWFQPIYTNVDNFITSMVIGAVYDKDTYSMVLNPVLCWIMSFVGKVLPTADAFTLVTKVVLLAGIGSISYFVALHFRHWPERLFAGAVLFLLTIEMNLFSDYFMVWAGILHVRGNGMAVKIHEDRSAWKLDCGRHFFHLLWSYVEAGRFCTLYSVSAAGLGHGFSVWKQRERRKAAVFEENSQSIWTDDHLLCLTPWY